MALPFEVGCLAGGGRREAVIIPAWMGLGEGERQSPMGEGFSSLISFNIGDPGISRLYSRTTR